MNSINTTSMIRPGRCKISYCSLLITLILVLSGCSTNPAKELADEEQYGELYSGSDEVKRTHEAARTAETAEEAIALGDKALHKGEYDEAVFQYIKAMELNEGDTETINKIGDIQNKIGKYAHAGQAYQLTLDQEPDNQHALEGLGLVQLRDRNYEQAKANLSRALALKPDLWRAHNALGTIADLEGDHVAAINHYRKSLLLQPASQNVINNYGYSLYLSGDWNAALAQFRKAININPNFERAWYNIGLVYARQGRFGEALGAFDNVMGRPQAYNDIGYICMINGDYVEAEGYFSKAIKLSSTYYKKAHNNLDTLYRLKARNTGKVASRQRDVVHDSVKTDISEISGSRAPVSGGNNSGNPRSKTADPDVSRVAAVVESSSSPDVPAEPPKAENIQVASVVTTVGEKAADTVSSVEAADSGPAADDMVKTDTVDMNNIPDHAGSTTPAGLQGPDDYMDMEKKYREALLLINRKQYAEAALALDRYLAAFPGSQHAGNASYWLGESYYARHEYDKAQEIFSSLVTDYPDSSMLAEARLKLGYLHYEKQDWHEARQELSLVVSEYPRSEAAQLADYRLKHMSRNGH
jgi:tol-pal system protein YbgF